MRILLVQPSLNPPGGGNAVAAWMLQALARDHDLTVLTSHPVLLARVNAQFGTSLRREDATWQCMAEPRHPLLRLPIRGALVADFVLCRHARSIRCGYDLAVTANNESDIGAPAIQYVHYPKLDPFRPDAAGGRPRPSLVAAYQLLAGCMTGFSRARACSNLTLSNSDWTARRLRDALGVEARVLSPPVAMAQGRAPFEARRDRFVAVGRLTPEKRLEQIVEIVETLRERGWRSELLILAASDDKAYGAHIERLAATRGWLQVRRDVSREELARELHQSRWGLHAMHDEHYGMAVAEMVRAGCLVFAHDSGGQREILGDAHLFWLTSADAVARIEAAAADAGLRAKLTGSLAARAATLGTENFLQAMRALVAQAAQSGPRSGQ